ncbi:MAG TPA: pyridoxal-phosphate dependent enzyme [Phycisphaerae bacterium]|nr:pyridoxal-phosphate dependent enzyme [Phycisphaerae bacterium]
MYAKAEFLNPGGSIKDRVARAMLEGAKRDGKLKPDSIIVEPTSGNTGIGIALAGRLMGYKVRIVMPENMSVERKRLIKALGADLVLTPATLSIGGAVDAVRRMADEDAIETTRQLGRDRGLPAGISSGANVWAARQLARRYKGNIATVLPDRAERYFSTSLM